MRDKDAESILKKSEAASAQRRVSWYPCPGECPVLLVGFPNVNVVGEPRFHNINVVGEPGFHNVNVVGEPTKFLTAQVGLGT